MNMKRRFSVFMYAAVTLGSFVADQTIKAVIRKAPLNSILYQIDGLLEITHCMNTGAAFSILRDHTVLITLLSSILILGAAFYLLEASRINISAGISLSFLVGGGLGNLYDRIVYDGVTDYIRLLFIDFPVFNLADICITLSVLFLSYYLLTGRLDVHPDEKDYGSNH